MDEYDVIVVGAGPAGYTAAIRAAQLGMKVACIDDSRNKDGAPTLGGTCLNWGCIPSKALLDASHKFVDAKEKLATFGIATGEVSMDVPRMIARKDEVVAKLTGGIGALFEGNGVTALAGHGKLMAQRRVEYAPQKGEPRTLQAKHVILASGSLPDRHLPGAARRRVHRRLQRRFGVRRGAAPPGRDRRWRGRPGARQRLGAAGRRGGHPRSAGRFSRLCRSSHRPRRPARVRQTRAGHSARHPRDGRRSARRRRAGGLPGQERRHTP